MKRSLLLSTLLIPAFLTVLTAAEPSLEELTGSGVDFLRNSQADDGSWTAPNRPGVSGLITTSLLASGLTPDDPTVTKALDHLESFVQKDGGIYDPEGNHRNYETCIILMAFEKANKDGRYDTQIKNAEKFLRNLQWDEGEGLETSDTSYGGAGYGSHQRPDMSNTQFFVDALKAAGASEDDPAIQKALIFMSRAQNLESEYNQTTFAGKINDGGFFYTPAAGGETKAGETDNGGLRSYGSMTYAGLKSMIYAGLDKDDVRVDAALGWIKKHYTLDSNPGMGEQGLFYYYHTFAKTLDVMGKETVVSADGTEHDWDAELIAKLASMQRDNGSWVNKADRWYEGDPNLVTAYTLLALSHCKQK